MNRIAKKGVHMELDEPSDLAKRILALPEKDSEWGGRYSQEFFHRTAMEVEFDLMVETPHGWYACYIYRPEAIVEQAKGRKVHQKGVKEFALLDRSTDRVINIGYDDLLNFCKAKSAQFCAKCRINLHATICKPCTVYGQCADCDQKMDESVQRVLSVLEESGIPYKLTS